MTKFVLATSFSSSVIAQAAHGFRHQSPPYLHWFTQSLIFRHPGELACGTLLLYYFRLFERQRGSAKHGACTATVLAISYTLQTAATALTHTALPAGPYGLIFANFVPFIFDVPPAQRFTLFGLPMTDKASSLYSSVVQRCCSNLYSSSSVARTATTTAKSNAAACHCAYASEGYMACKLFALFLQ